MMFGHAFLSLRNLCLIFHMYLCISSLSGPKFNSTLSKNNYALLYVSEEIVATKPVFDLSITRQASPKPISSSTRLLLGCRLLLNIFLSTFLITLSNDVATNPGPTVNHTLPSPKARGLKISHLNIRSLFPKIDSLRLMLKDQPFDIFTISETWLNSSITDQELYIPGYTLTRQDRTGKHGGGTAIYIRDGIPFRARPDLMEMNAIETCCIEIVRPKTKKLLVCTIYRAPTFPVPKFLEELDVVVSKLPDDFELIILGDFNVDYNSKNPATKSSRSKLKSFANLHDLDQLISSPTRITTQSQSTIDLIFVNNKQRIVDNGVLPISLSDHSLVYCVYKTGVPKAPPRIIEYRSYKHYDKQTFLKDLINIDWSPIFTADVDVAVNTWCSLFTNVADHHAPIKRQRVKGLKTPWMTSELSQLMRDRDNLHAN